MRWLPFLSALLLPLPSASPGQAQEPRPLELEDYFRLESVGSPAISPDGRWVVFERTTTLREENRAHSELWIVPADGSEAPRPLTAPSFDASSPRWSPDGSLLAFSSRRSLPGEEDGHWWFLRMDGRAGEAFQIKGIDQAPVFGPMGAQVALTRATPPIPPKERTGRPDEAGERTPFEEEILERFDGRDFDWMSYRFDRRGYLPDPRDPRATPASELYLVPITGGRGTRITEMGVDVSDPAWRPDGSMLVFVADEHQRDEDSYERADLWAATLEGTVLRLTDDPMDYSAPAWSPDGRFIVARGNMGLDVVIREKWDHGAPSDLFLFPSEGGEGRNLTEDWDLIPGSPSWSPDGEFIFFTAGISGTDHLFRVAVDSGEVEQVTRGERSVGSVSFSADGTVMAFSVSDPGTPGDIFSARPDGSDERRLSHMNRELLSRVRLSAPENIHFRSSDGTELEGWIMPPVAGGDEASGNGGHPLVVTIHGGPHSAYDASFMFEQQLLAGQGYFVLYLNPRASTGYGEEFRWGTWGGWGLKDYEDVMAGVDYVLERYDIDPARMGVTGYSYGGFLTNMVIVRTNRFAAAIAGAGISNWVSDYATSDIPRTKESEFYGPPWEAESLELLLRSSPVVHAGDVETPTLFLHGESDYRVPIAQAEEMYMALRKQGVPARFVRYPESYHGGWTPWRLIHRYWASLGWWRRWLKEDGNG